MIPTVMESTGMALNYEQIAEMFNRGLIGAQMAPIFPHHIEVWEHGVIIKGQKIRLYSETDPTKVPWGEHGVATVMESTASQAVVDQAVKKGQSYRGGRATGVNIVPYSTGAAKALGKVIPSLKGKVTGMSFRVPTINVSVIDFTFKTAKEATYEELSAVIKKASEGDLKGILGYTEDEVVSSDFLHDSHSSTYDKGAGISLNKNFHKVVSWYDNEWGYANRMVDLAKHIQKTSGI
ncbi:unnamed protein product [Sphagnum balticum]